MRIGMLSWESLYSIKVGGVAPHVSELSEALARRGNEVHIFTRRGDYESYDKINGVHYQRVDVRGSGDILFQMNQMCDALIDRFQAVKDLFGKFDIVHGHDWHPVLALSRIRNDNGLPAFLTMHSTEWGRNGNQFGYGISEDISYREWLGCYESSKVIVTTKHMKEELIRIYSVPESKIVIIPNGIMPGKMKRVLDPGRVKERYGIHPLAPMILFCGRMSIQKGPDLLVEAIPHVLKKRPDARFVFMGEGDMKAACEHRVSELGVSGRCSFLGYIPSDAKQELVNACDLMCVPSRNEPFGVVVLEAWDASKPVVATEAVSLIRNFEDGLMAYMQPQSIAWCINRLLSDPAEMEKIARAGCSRIESEFRWDHIAQKTEEVYAEVLA